MTRAVYEQIHAQLAADEFWARRKRGETGRVALASFAATEAAARQTYRALPFWRRMGF